MEREAMMGGMEQEQRAAKAEGTSEPQGLPVAKRGREEDEVCPPTAVKASKHMVGDPPMPDGGAGAAGASVKAKAPTAKQDLKTLERGFESLLKAPTDFAASGSLPSPPTLKVPGLQRTLSYPLSNDDVKALAAMGQAAPFGKGEETVVDTAVRKATQLNPDQFTLTHSSPEGVAWRPVDATAAAAAVLSPGGPSVRAELHKMVIYQKGDFFKPHKDTPRGDGFFATLSITLPCKHAGGAVVVRHSDEARSLESAPSSAKGKYQWACWYADVEHEVQPLEGGTRVALLYNLFRTPGVARGAGAEVFATSPAHPIVAAMLRLRDDEYEEEEGGAAPSGYSSDEDPPRRLGLLLEHQYTPKQVHPDKLKGRDAVIFETLKRHGMCVTVAPVEVRFNAWGNSDSAKYAAFGEWERENLEIEVSELDASKPMPKGSITKFESRDLYDIKWLHDLEECVVRGKRTDRRVQGSGNEGCDFHETYCYSALLIHLDGDKDGGLASFSSQHSRRAYPYKCC